MSSVDDALIQKAAKLCWCFLTEDYQTFMELVGIPSNIAQNTDAQRRFQYQREIMVHDQGQPFFLVESNDRERRYKYAFDILSGSAVCNIKHTDLLWFLGMLDNHIYLRSGSKTGSALNQRLRYWRNQQEKKAKKTSDVTSVMTNSSTITSIADHTESQSKLVNAVPLVTLAAESSSLSSKQKSISPLSMPLDLQSAPFTQSLFFLSSEEDDKYEDTGDHVDVELVLPTKQYDRLVPTVASLTDSLTTRRTIHQAQTNRQNEIDEQHIIETMFMLSLLLWN